MQVYRKAIKTIFMLVILLISACEADNWNDPYPYEDTSAKTLFTVFTERPKHLDPAISYTVTEASITSQIYEPPLQYHYLKRPYELEPLTAVSLPKIEYFSADGKLLAENSKDNEVAYSEYLLEIKPGIYYEPHPAFVKASNGTFLYHHLTEKEAEQYHTLADFKETATKELTAEDYVYQIKRLAEPNLNSPIYGLMSKYIEGLSELRQVLLLERQEREKQAKDNNETFYDLETDLRAFPLIGVSVVDRYQYKIRIKGKYPQFRFWLAMNFFAPIPYEVAAFYAQPGLQKHNISLDWYPVGTGPFRLIENNPDRRMTLIKNVNFREAFFPTEGSEQDEAQGLLSDAGQKIPLLDKVVFSLERESIPYWNKFLQGYFDISGIASDNFTSAIRLNPEGQLVVTEPLANKGIRLNTSVSPNVFYWGFNMLDKTVGGKSEAARKLRQAISLAFNVEEFISIFLNGRGEIAYGPIPPDIFGFETQLNTGSENNRIEKPNPGEHAQHKFLATTTDRKTKRLEAINKAKQLLKEAGYAKGLTIYLDTVASGEPDEIAIHAWLKEQFEQLGIQLVIRGSQYNRFQDRVLQGDTQMFFFGWSADYPDPENFLFLFYGPNSSAQFGGENKSNYSNPEFDRLFEKMRLLEDGPERYQIIAEMIKILQKDSPWVWGFFPKSFVLYQQWIRITKPSAIINNNLKYFKVNGNLRHENQKQWNHPKLWPLFFFFAIIASLIVWLIFHYWLTQTKTVLRK